MNEWTEFDGTWWDFAKKGLAVPGMLIKVEGLDGHVLIGDINEMRGTCDCHALFRDDGKVLRYTHVEWEPQTKEKSDA